MATASRLLDQDARERFIDEADGNFSVIAPAGVGKTRAIVERVVRMAMSQRADDWLPRLVIVTYTNKAADEMQQRARNRLLAQEGGAIRMSAFNRAFFGTIHSFCLTLLTTYGHHIGLPGRVETLAASAEDALWTRFFREVKLQDILPQTESQHLAACLRHLPLQDVLRLGKTLASGLPRPTPLEAPPVPRIGAILDFCPSSRNQHTVAVGKERAAAWQAAYDKGEPYLPLPVYEKGGAEFRAVWQGVFKPLRDWLSKAVFLVAWYTAHAFRDYRRCLGQLTYSDQISLVLDLLGHPEAGSQIRGRGLRVILDEAQDTDPEQFRVLIELARPAGATGVWADGPETADPPMPGRFSMVGDPQQSIYGGRADLSFYEAVRNRLMDCKVAEEIAFQVTFRCDVAVTDLANGLCPAMLNGTEGQVEYVPLHVRPGAGPGRVLVRDIGECEGVSEPKVDQQASFEADVLARWLKTLQPRDLGARTWGRVAVLCPRKRWFDPIECAFLKFGIPFRNLSVRSSRGDDPAYAWFTALAVCVAEPDNGFEIAGVLREVFGLSDQALYDFAQGDGSRFQVRMPAPDAGGVGRALKVLHRLFLMRERVPLFEMAARLVADTHLDRRLAGVEDDEGAGSSRVLASLLASAASAEAEGKSFAEWAESLRNALGDTHENLAAGEDGIELMTCHAAKGLEWDAVILPFLHRRITTRGNAYPYVHSDASRRACSVVFDKSWLEGDEAVRIHRRVKQETQRLLYVAMTRARRTLVLVHDRALFGGAQSDSFAQGLGLEDESRAARFRSLVSAPGPVPPLPEPPAPPPVREPLPLLERENVAAALARAERFPRRILPHALAESVHDAEPEQTFEHDPDWMPAARDAAMEYGIWWHSLMEKLDWQHPATWGETYKLESGASPDPSRADHEWTLFLASEAARRLSAPSVQVYVELPFMRRSGHNVCTEGYIDLVAFDSACSAWLVVDWKTNRIDRDGLAALAQQYRPQLMAYAEALRVMAGDDGSVEVMLYATACGRAVFIA
jgi:ATP-dependent helicase/nuclease subunit A